MESPRGTVHATTTDAHSRIPQCCCGNSDCPYLSHNGHLLEGLERDVQTAAQLGQALLQRHEAYIADSEAERRRMAAKIEELEREKADLESKNAQSIQENRDLLDQLEAMNNAVADSDKRIADLSKHLSSTQDELTRLTNQASRTETLERQLASLEKEQVDLQSRLSSTAGESKSAVQRWRKAERIINELQEQIERIERESREERERHVEIVGRMERRRAVEKELETAAGRLKGAAAAKVAQSKTDTNVVSHFVKDILQDNANLQIGIVELRDMLTNANEEVERLREQLMLHQPLDEPCESEAGVPNLQNELGFDPEVTSPKSPEKSPSYLPNEYHVHHHLHFKPDASKDAPKAKGNVRRRPSKKKRTPLAPGQFAPTSNHTPQSSICAPRPSSPCTAASILSHTSVTIPNHRSNHRHHWSIQSQQTGASVASSVPSSPFEASRRTSSIFDRMFSDGQESSRPTSPESNDDPGSPVYSPIKGGILTHGINRTSTMPVTMRSLKSPTTTQGPQKLSLRIPEEDLAIPEEVCEPANQHEPPLDTQPPEINRDIYSTLRRQSSHESLLSVSGMDIHTLQSRPSQILFAPSSPSKLARGSLSSMTARPSLSYKHDTDALSSYQSLLSNSDNNRRRSSAASRPGSRNSNASVGKRIGGWMFGKWGAAPTPTPSTPEDDPRSSETSETGANYASAQAAPTSTADDSTPTPNRPATSSSTSSNKARLRASGVNQLGAVPGMRAEPVSTPTTPKNSIVQTSDVDVDALGECLAEAGDSPVRLRKKAEAVDAKDVKSGVGLIPILRVNSMAVL
ncbi:hypothetical protein IWX49DRAFT_201495 [Phyllosticta citricarpa]|uniref:Uncharacterized protein n=1 Tax=Phyllosticta citricarpa TaxID=55181 RepID=A0ABR1LZV5_9PEZI